MTILLTKDLRVGGSVLTSGTTQTFAADLEADIVARNGKRNIPLAGKSLQVVPSPCARQSRADVPQPLCFFVKMVKQGRPPG